MSKNRLNFQAQMSRHSHDLSAGYTASVAPGMIIPQYFHVMGPGDTIYYSSRMFARLKDVVTAFLGEIDIHMDSFFVPLQMMYTPFGQVFAQTDDLISSMFDSANFDSSYKFPLLNVKDSIERKKNSDPSTVGFECHGKSVFRLLDALDLNPLGVCSYNQQSAEEYQSASAIDDQITHNPKIAPWIVGAYQCIYQKFYRNDEIERLSIEAYNFDSYYNVPSFESSSFLALRYVQRPKDYFTSVRVSPIASAVNSFFSTNPVDGGTLDSVLYQVDSFLDSSKTNYSSVGSNFNVGDSYPSNYLSFDSLSTGANAFLNNLSTPTNTTLSTANIRALFAVDKFARIYGRADKTYDDQILAHFGIRIPHDVKHDITHLKHDRAVLQADPIYATASTVNYGSSAPVSVLGQVGGQGQVTFTSQQDKFTAPVHGVFMVVAYVTVKPRYVGTFNKLHLTTERLRFPIPEFDKLGAQPLYAFEAHPQYFQRNDTISTRIGWQNRYEEFKQKYNRASFLYYSGEYGHGSVNANSFGPWVVSQLPYQRNINSNVLPTVPGSGTPTSSFVSARLLFQSPFALDNVMIKPFEAAWNDLFFDQPHAILFSDPVLTEYYCDCKLVSWMSETGEPDL